VAVRGGRKSLNAARASGQRGQHRIAMRYGLIAGQLDGAGDRARRKNLFLRHKAILARAACWSGKQATHEASAESKLVG
jgi:hypothetical protein